MSATMVRSVAVEEAGEGEPLLLLHGTGGTRAHWAPVRERLAAEHALLLVDLPGHGESAVPRGVTPDPAGYATILAGVLDQLGHDTVHVAGNSVGGWTALELAKLGRARSVVALGPAGLWADGAPLSSRLKLRGQYRMGRRLARAVPALMRSPRGRSILFHDSMARPRRVPPEAAVGIAAEFSATPDFERHMDATVATRFRDGAAIGCPVTIAWGEKERLVPRKARLLTELPAGTRVVTLPGCGHVPMWDDPELIARTILDGER
jgi:pimeloyl-ACP methyl ester carboxylesterase